MMKNLIAQLTCLFLATAPVSAQNTKPSSAPATAAKSVNPLPAVALAKAGSTYAVVVGISDYQDPGIPDLRFADKDAEAFANFLRSPAGGSLDGDHLKLLTNESATAGQVGEALYWLVDECKEGDQAIIYFSGHGDVERKLGRQPGFLLCWDAPPAVYISGGVIELGMFQEVISTLSIDKKVKVAVITDACHAGKLAGSQVGGAQITGASLAKQYANEIKILSCQPNEYSIEGEQWGGGRGAFSFNLVDALYGMADGNNDLFVTLQEVGRYLEDHVSAEVAPVSQVPMVLGNRAERLANVDSKLLADLRSGKTSQMAMLSPIESRGMEEDVLAGVDTTVRELYRLFKKALKEKVFLEPANTCADAYYEQLMAESKMQRLHTTMTRNYAAALQDDAQQAMNIWLAADVQQLECIGNSLKLEPIPRQLQRAAELLGKGHYMYRSLQARKLLFDGISKMKSENPDETLGRDCLSLFWQSLELEPNSALPWHRICLLYANNLRQPDSAFVCAHKARDLAPNWVLPYADLGYVLCNQGKFELAKLALEEAMAIDSLHPYVINGWAVWLKHQPGKANKEQALSLFVKYRDNGGLMYPCWHNDYGLLLYDLGKNNEGEEEMFSAIAMDSTSSGVWNNLGYIYWETGRFVEAEQALKKSIVLDSTRHVAWDNLGKVYQSTGRYTEAEEFLKKSIALDSTFATHWSNLGLLYLINGRYAEAEQALKKSITLDSTSKSTWNNLGGVYFQTCRYAEAELFFKKSIALDSTFANPRKHLGMVYYKTNRPEEARQNLLKAIELNPDYGGAMLGMAYILAAEGKTEKAVGYVEQAIGKGSTFEQLEKDEDLAPLRATPEWKSLMKKYFPDQVKD